MGIIVNFCIADWMFAVSLVLLAILSTVRIFWGREEPIFTIEPALDFQNIWVQRVCRIMFAVSIAMIICSSFLHPWSSIEDESWLFRCLATALLKVIIAGFWYHVAGAILWMLITLFIDAVRAFIDWVWKK